MAQPAGEWPATAGPAINHLETGTLTMLNSLKQTGQHLGHELNRAWISLSEGWHELFSRSSNALTPFTHPKPPAQEGAHDLAPFPRWSLLAGEVEETPTDLVVRVELPGMDQDDCRITIEGNVLCLSGEKRFERDTHDSTYHVMERAYGAFQRSIFLPRNVNIDLAEASFKNGVLTVRLPKEGVVGARSIPVT
jgi:HSP20 family protein